MYEALTLFSLPLFPLGTVIAPRTLCLDSGQRSCLNSGYVLA